MEFKSSDQTKAKSRIRLVGIHHFKKVDWLKSPILDSTIFQKSTTIFDQNMVILINFMIVLKSWIDYVYSAYKIIKAKTMHKSLTIHPYRLFRLEQLISRSTKYKIHTN